MIYLLDANILISAFDTDSTTDIEKRNLAKDKLKSVLSDEQNKIVITPLIYFEVLRGVPLVDEKRFQTLKSALENIMSIDIKRDSVDIAIELFRINKHKNPEYSKKHQFDLLHFSTAKHEEKQIAEEIVLLSLDDDIKTIEAAYDEYINT